MGEFTSSFSPQQGRTAHGVAQYIKYFCSVEANLFSQSHCLSKPSQHCTHQHVQHQFHLCGKTHLT